MKTLGCVLLVGALGLFGCGDDDDDDDDIIVFPDASVEPDAPGGDCNSVSQTGCAEGEKCTWIVDQLSPEVGHVGCIAEGAGQLGDACTDATVKGGTDTCAAGGYCYQGTCRQICTTVNDTCADGQYGDFVDGMGNPFPIEWCLEGCSIIDQDCSNAAESCFLSDGEGICLGHDEVAVGDPCQFTNDCAEGGQCFGDACRQLCGTIDEMWGDDGADPPLLTWPLCCGPNCTTASLPCSRLTDMCWLVSDGTDTGIANIGICEADTEASNPDATMPWTCDCNSVAAEKCSFDP